MSASEKAAKEEAPEDMRDEQPYEKQVTLDEALSLAQAHHRSGNLTIADRTYRDILRAVPDHFPTVHFMAMLLLQRGNLEEALEFAQKATEVAPDHAACWVHYGVILSANERHEDALEALDEAMMIDPDLFEVYSNKSYVLWQLDRFEEAEEVAAQATVINPDNPDAYINLGISLASQRKYEEADEVWQQVIDLAPDSGKGYSNWCNTLCEMGRYDEAKDKGLKALEMDGENHEAWNNLGNAWRELGDIENAADAYQKATSFKPDYFRAHMNLAIMQLDQQKYREALTAARYAVSFEPKSMEALCVLSQAQKEMGLLDDAYQAADKVINLKPNDPLGYLNFADILIAMDNFDEADIMVARALEFEPDDVRTLMKLAHVRNGQSREAEAVEALDKALERAPDNIPIMIEKAKIMEHDSRVEEGLAVIEQVLALAPQNPMAVLCKIDMLLTINRKEEAGKLLEESRGLLDELPSFYYQLTSYKKFTEDDPDFAKIKEMAKKAIEYGPGAQAIMNYALFSVYESMKDYDKAFEHLKLANDYNKEKKQYNEQGDRNGLLNVKRSFTREFIDSYKGEGCESDIPVFILGMPRSGTTLTEQIISSHPEVYPAGELSDLGAVIRELGPLKHENAAEIGQAYVDKVMARNKGGAGIVRVTDKMPGNYQSIGLIRCILPNAKIIHCRRNAADNLLSCYKQNFAMGHYWSYDLEWAARHYTHYADLMDYWRETLPGEFLEVDYEETVADLETQARKLIDYVGLEWNDACLEPHKQKRAVLTASKNQVIQPVYKSSVEAWKRYEKQLEPMIAILKEANRI